MRRVTLGLDPRAGYRSTGVGDEYLRLLFPAEGEKEPVLPRIVDGGLDYGSIDLSLLRTYTVRAFEPDAGELTIDFVIHDGGVAAQWARDAQPGDVVGLNSPTGMYDPPEDLDWQILAADCAALPAASRILESTPARCARDSCSRCRTTTTASSCPSTRAPRSPGSRAATAQGPERAGRGRARRCPDPDGVGYVWVAGESRALRGVRRYLRHELGLPSSEYKAVGYWIDGGRALAARSTTPSTTTTRALARGALGDRPDEAEIEDEYDERLTELGL